MWKSVPVHFSISFFFCCFMMFPAGCSENSEFRRELDQMQEKQYALRASQQELREVLESVRRESEGSGKEVDKKLASLRNEFEDFYAGLVKQIQDINRQFTQALEQSLDANRNKTQAESSGLRKRFDAKIQEVRSEIDRVSGGIETRIKTLEKRVDTLMHPPGNE